MFCINFNETYFTVFPSSSSPSGSSSSSSPSGSSSSSSSPSGSSSSSSSPSGSSSPSSSPSGSSSSSHFFLILHLVFLPLHSPRGERPATSGCLRLSLVRPSPLPLLTSVHTHLGSVHSFTRAPFHRDVQIRIIPDIPPFLS